MSGTIKEEAAELKAQLWGSFLLFVQTFFPLVTGREFTISQPTGRESHFITVSRELTKVARGQTTSLLINMPPGYAKSTMISMWIAWTLSRYQNSQFLYISYGKHLAAKHTEFIRRIIMCPQYKTLFGVEIRDDSRAKDSFQTKQGGSIKAFGSSGPITGQDAGLPNCDHFSGALVIDDPHKPDEVHSDTIREGVITNYRETILQRPRGPNVPLIFIGQCLHEADLAAFLKSGEDERQWKQVVIKALDEAGNALYPEVNPLAQLLEKQEKNPYVFSAQYQQNPIPAGGALFKRKDFVILEEEPKILLTFITADTAETAKSYNDATVFSFWGLYNVTEAGLETGQMGLHWLDCMEIRIEPRELENAFRSFYGDCLLHPVKPLLAAIEKKSTGVTLISVLDDMRGLHIREVKRTRASGSKTERFLEMQPIIAAKLISFTQGAKHIEPCITHMMKITANQSHRNDDVCHVAGSKIATIYGDKNVEDIRVGDQVITPFGIGRVSACGMTGYHEVINKIGLTSTPDHQVFTENGFLPLDTLSDTDKINTLSFKGLVEWRLKRLLFSMERNMFAESRESIIEVAQELQKMKPFIAIFIDFIAAKKYQKAFTFTIKTAIDLIIVTKIWSFYRAANTLKYIQGSLSRFNISLQNGIRAPRAENGIGKTGLRLLKKGLQSALFAARNLVIQNPVKMQQLAAVNATPLNIDLNLDNLRPTAQYVEPCLLPRKDTPNQETEKLARINVEEILQQPTSKNIKAVYAVTVETYGVYYCNGILLRNCDTLYDAVKIALIDKSIRPPSAYEDEQATLKVISNKFTHRLNTQARAWR